MSFEIGVTFQHAFKPKQQRYLPFPDASIFIDSKFHQGCARIFGQPLKFRPYSHVERDERKRIETSGSRRKSNIDIFLPCMVVNSSRQYFSQCARSVYNQHKLDAYTHRFCPELTLKITVNADFDNQPSVVEENDIPLPDPVRGDDKGDETFSAYQFKIGGKHGCWPVSIYLPGRSLDKMALAFSNGSVDHVQARRKAKYEDFQINKTEDGFKFSCIRESIISDVDSVSNFTPLNLRRKLAASFGMKQMRPRYTEAYVAKRYTADATSAKCLDAALSFDH